MGSEGHEGSGSIDGSHGSSGEPAGARTGARWARLPQGKRLWIPAAALIALAILLVYLLSRSSGRSAGGESQPAAAITVAQSKAGDINVYVEALGTVTPTYTVSVYSQITGRIMEVHYQEGQRVHQGDPLIDIDPRPYQATLLQAQGTLRHDEGVLTQARLDLQIYKAAYARNGIGRQQLQDQEQAVVQAEGSVMADRGTVEYDSVQLAYCHITAPITGRVGLRLVDPGNVVFSGSSATLLVITQLQPITVVFNVSEDDLPQVEAQLSAGHTLQVDAFDRSNERLIESGTLTSLDNQVDTATGTVRFRAKFANARLALFPNQFVNARLLVRTLANVTLVPTAAVQHNGTAAFVYVVKPDHTVAVQNVTTPASNEQDTAVQGLGPGVTVATSGFDRLDTGTRVSIRAEPSSASSSSG